MFGHARNVCRRGNGAVRDVGSSMSDRPVLQPSATHPITVEPTGKHVTVRVNGGRRRHRRRVDPAGVDVPRGAVHPLARCRVVGTAQASDTTRTARSRATRATTTSSTGGGVTVEDAIWTYEEPYPAVARIAGHVAFYPEKADIGVT